MTRIFLLWVLCFPGFAANSNRVLYLENQYPLALLHDSLPVESAAVIDSFRLELSAAWSNTYNAENSDYLVDVESRRLLTRFRWNLDESTEAAAELPFLWWGGGILDSPIESWDSLLGFSNKRNNAPDDRYVIRGRNRDGSTFALTDRGFGVGSSTVGLKRELSDHWSMTGRIRLAVGRYAASGVDGTLGFLGQWSTGPYHLHWGAGGTALSDSEYLGVQFRPFRVAGFGGVTYDLTPTCALYTTLWGGSGLLRSLPQFPGSEFYLDVGVVHDIGEGVAVTWTLRENPVQPDDTTDFTVAVGTSVALGRGS